MSILVCGSIAYDTIMVFHDRFKEHILPEQIHILNVSFLVPDMRREFGGCAGNIAYSLKLLGESPLIMATVGEDAGMYMQRLQELALDSRHVRRVPDTFTAQAFITTDMDGNQITAFHPGAMMQSHFNRVEETEGVSLGIISPDGREGMIEHAEQFSNAGIPFVFDPGQGMPLFSGQDLLRFLSQARYCTMNDYEARLFSERTGYSLERIAEQVEALIVTRGGEGAHIYTGGECLDIPCAPISSETDPTGCGDAYRAGVLYGISRGYDWLQTGRLSAVMGAIKIEHRGAQNHLPEPGEIERRYEQAFGERITL